ncbi:MAG: zf-TFIIB domain-containing protein [Polyangiaceae bacterium]
MSKDPYRSGPPGPTSRRMGEGIECPGCSRRIDESLRSCPSCGAPIAVVRCAHCFHMNPLASALCNGCGHELGLEPLGEPDSFACPDCKLPFQAFEGGPGRLRDCGKCGGQFVEHALLKDLLEQRELYGQSAPRPPPRQNPLASPLRYVPCPMCAEIMTRRNFGRTSGVIVDVCGRHGVWFDRGELPRVLDFVEAGGLALLRERQAEEARESRRGARVAQLEKTLQPLHGPTSGNRFLRMQNELEMGEATLSLVGYLADLLKDG